MPSLMIEGEPRSHLILRKLTSIGRDPENDLVLGHATIAPNPDSFQPLVHPATLPLAHDQ